MPRTLVLALTLIAGAGRLPAQSAGARADTSASRECWRGEPAPTCDSFFITEFGVERIQTSSTTHFDIDYGPSGGVVHKSEPDFGNRLQFTVGPMFNRGRGRAIGATLSFSGVYNGFRAAVEGRHRWWAPGDET